MGVRRYAYGYATRYSVRAETLGRTYFFHFGVRPASGADGRPRRLRMYQRTALICPFRRVDFTSIPDPDSAHSGAVSTEVLLPLPVRRGQASE